MDIVEYAAALQPAAGYPMQCKMVSDPIASARAGLVFDARNFMRYRDKPGPRTMALHSAMVPMQAAGVDSLYGTASGMGLRGNFTP